MRGSGGHHRFLAAGGSASRNRRGLGDERHCGSRTGRNINDGMVMCGVSEFWQMVIKGLVIVLAVIIDQFQRNMQAKMALQARNENK